MGSGGKPVGVLVSPEEYERLRRVQAYLEMLRLSRSLQDSDVTADELFQLLSPIILRRYSAEQPTAARIPRHLTASVCQRGDRARDIAWERPVLHTAAHQRPGEAPFAKLLRATLSAILPQIVVRPLTLLSRVNSSVALDNRTDT